MTLEQALDTVRKVFDEELAKVRMKPKIPNCRCGSAPNMHTDHIICSNVSCSHKVGGYRPAVYGGTEEQLIRAWTVLVQDD